MKDALADYANQKAKDWFSSMAAEYYLSLCYCSNDGDLCGIFITFQRIAMSAQINLNVSFFINKLTTKTGKIEFYCYVHGDILLTSNIL